MGLMHHVQRTWMNTLGHYKSKQEADAADVQHIT